MAKDKKILITIPSGFNTRLNLHLIKIRDIGVETTKADLLIKLADLGLKIEEKEIQIEKL
jgi:hypothetical protein